MRNEIKSFSGLQETPVYASLRAMLSAEAEGKCFLFTPQSFNSDLSSVSVIEEAQNA